MRAPGLFCLPIAGATLLVGASLANAAIVPAEIVVQEGTMPVGAGVDADGVSSPFALADGSVAFVGGLVDGDDYVWSGDQIVWLNSDEMAAILTGGESSMGGAEGGAFVYSPALNGLDSVWTHNGLLAVENDQAPGFGAGTILTFNSRPSMIADGTAYWIAGINASGGASTEQRVLYRSPSAMPGDAEIVVASGDLVGGLTVSSPSGVDFDYHVSSGGGHILQMLQLDTGSVTNDGHVVLDGVLMHQESTLNGTGDNWDNFDLFSVNEVGTYVFSGDTDGAVTSDEFIAVDGMIAVREGDVVDGITLTSTATVRFIAINDQGRIAYSFAYNSGADETVFYACNSADVAGSSIAVATTAADEFDFDGDDVADATFADLNISSIGASHVLASDAIYLDADLDQGGTITEAMIRIPVTCCGNGNIDGGEECDDGNDDDTDLCPSTCQNAYCGDGFVLAGTEECDDGNNEDGDGCAADCAVEIMMGSTGTTTDGGESTDTGTTDGTTSTTSTTSTGDTTTGEDTGSSTAVGDASEDGPGSEDGTTTGGPDPTGGLDDTGTSSGGTGGMASSGAATTMTTAAPMDTSDGDTETEGDDGSAVGDDGCSCRSGGSGSFPVWALGLLVLVPRRRRAAFVALRGRAAE